MSRSARSHSTNLLRVMPASTVGIDVPMPLMRHQRVASRATSSVCVRCSAARGLASGTPHDETKSRVRSSMKSAAAVTLSSIMDRSVETMRTMPPAAAWAEAGSKTAWSQADKKSCCSDDARAARTILPAVSATFAALPPDGAGRGLRSGGGDGSRVCRGRRAGAGSSSWKLTRLSLLLLPLLALGRRFGLAFERLERLGILEGMSSFTEEMGRAWPMTTLPLASARALSLASLYFKLLSA
mmetsp:Transcript_29155/g.93003  ORF Transcript_29155/g.93003 Transcript_29155/m.93003 type:complete len:241 (-) Transcript_29155:111-833(-)